MNILYACKDNYARHLAVSMTSLFDRNRRVKKLTVYVISMGISRESQEKLHAIAAQYGRELVFIELPDVTRYLSHTAEGGFDISVTGWLFAGRLLPKEIGRILYIDCDTVIAQSLMELWRTNLDGYVLAAVMEPTIYTEVKKNLGLTGQDIYIDAGVLLIDLKRWRETDAEGRLLDFYEKKEGKLFACDQDMVNGTLQKEIKTLPPKYNFFPNYRYFSYKDLVRHMPSYARVTEAEFKEAKHHPVIIHYAGDERPWIAGNMNHYRKAYEKYLAMTPWAGTPKERGKEFYMMAYHLMDYATAVCPPIRWFISEHLAMRIVAARNRKRSHADKSEKTAD